MIMENNLPPYLNPFDEPRIEGLFDDDKRLDHNSWTIGGTFVTNFNTNQTKAYALAIEEYEKENPSHGLVISKYAYAQGRSLNCHSLHHLTPGNLSDFWKIFDKYRHETN